MAEWLRENFKVEVMLVQKLPITNWLLYLCSMESERTLVLIKLKGQDFYLTLGDVGEHVLSFNSSQYNTIV